MATNTAASFTNHTGNGTAGPFNISFSYLSEAEVDVTVGGVLKTITTHYTFTSATQITFTSGNEPANGVAIKFQRDTNISAKKVDFADGSVLTEADLDANSDQVLFAQQEIIDKLGTIEEGATGDQTAAEIRTLVESASDSNVFTDNDHTKLNNIEANATQDQTISEIKSLIAGSPLDASHLAANSVDSSELVDGSVDTSHLSADCVTNAKIADDSIDSEHYVDGSIRTQHIANTEITTAKLDNNAVTTAKINNSAVTADKIQNAAITTAKIGNDQVTTAKIGNDQVTTDKIADSGITTAKIAADAINSTKIADDSINSEHYVDGSIDTAHIANNAVTTGKIADAELKTLAGMQSGTASKLADSTALTSDIADLNQLDGMAKQTTITDDDTKFPTSGAVVDFVAAQIAPIGGLEVIANEDSFPTTQPASGVVVSISDIDGLIVNGSGVATNARTSGNGSDNVTINGFPSSLQSKTMAAGLGLMVSSTGSSQTYTYHKLLAKEADVEQLSNDINDFAARYRVTNGEPTSNNDEGDLIYDKDADKMKVFDSSTNSFKEVTSVGDYKFLFLCPAGGSGSPTINGSIATYDLREGSTSGSAASITNAAQLIVSINGVIQKPNTGTSAPSEGFAMVDSNTIIFGSNLPTGAEVFIIQIGSATTLNVPADNSVATAKIQNQGVTTAKIADDAVTQAKIAANAVDTTELAVGAVTHDQLADNTVDADHLQSNAVTNAKVSASAAIAGTKIDPNFGSQNIVTTGNVGIGTTSPARHLHLNSSTSDTVQLHITNSTTGTTGSDGVSFALGSDESLIINQRESNHIALKTADTERMRIDSSGNVVVGATSANASDSCTLNSDGEFRGAGYYFTNNIGSPMSSDGIRRATTGTMVFDTASAERMRIDSSGRLFLGLTSSSFPKRLNIQGSSGAIIALNNNDTTSFAADTNTSIEFGLNTGNTGNQTGSCEIRAFKENGTNGNNARALSFYTGVNGGSPNERLRVDSSGRVLIDTTSNFGTTLAKLQVNGNGIAAAVFNRSNDGVVIGFQRGAGSDVGTISLTASSTAYNTSSDYRLKENEVAISDGISRIKTLKPYRFNFKVEPDKTVDGFFAHEVTAVPEAITGTKDEVDENNEPVYQGIDQSKLVPLLTAALQEAIAKIEVLETKVAALGG